MARSLRDVHEAPAATPASVAALLKLTLTLALALAPALAGCGGDDAPLPGGGVDGGRDDASRADGAEPDGAGDAETAFDGEIDGSGPDAGPPPPPDALTRAAVVFGSCVPDDGIAGFLLSVLQHQGRNAELTPEDIACLADTGGGCDAVSTCLGITVDWPASCAPGCDGALWTSCADDVRTRVDCARAGLGCDPAWGCVALPVAECDPVSYMPGCEDGRPSYCDGIVRHGPDCGAMGLVCGPAPEGDAVTCRGDIKACVPEYWRPEHVLLEGEECMGDSVEVCANGGIGVIDCTGYGEGFSCRSFAGEHFCGRAEECTPEVRPVECDGSTVIFCNVGRTDRVDCTSLGFGGCEAGAHGGCTPAS